jgi:hypothetical protein
MLRSPARPFTAVLAATLLLAPSTFAFDTPLSDEAVREAYFLGQRNDQSTLSFFNSYLRLLPKPDTGAFIAEVEVYTPYVQVVETSRRRSVGYSAQQAAKDYRGLKNRIFVRIRIDFTPTYGNLELYRSERADRDDSDDSAPSADFSNDFRVGLSQKDKWVEPLRIIIQPTNTPNTGHYAFTPPDLVGYSYFSSSSGPAYAYSGSHSANCLTGWLVWLEYSARDVASDDSQVEVFTTDGQHVIVPFDLSQLR